MADDPTPIVPTETPTETQPTPPVENPTPPENPQPQLVSQETPQTSPTSPTSPDFPNSPDLSQPEVTVPPVTEEKPTEVVPPQPPPPEPVAIPTLSFPFYETVSPSLVFNQIPDDERIKQKFQEWGIVGHNGLDFPLSEGTEVLACNDGKITLAGPNGDYGNCVIIQHSWGQSYYAHFQETKVSVSQEIRAADLIGLSDTSGAAFGPHLHFAIKPNNADEKNGYLGFIDPAPYLKIETPKPQVPPPEPPTPPVEPKSVEQPISPPPIPELSEEKPKEEPQPVIEPTINIEPTPMPTQEVPKQLETPQISQNPQIPQPLQLSDEEIQKQVGEKFNNELDARRLKANKARQAKRQEHLQMIEKLIEEKKAITNQEVRDLTHVSQSTATEYLSMLVKSGTIKMEGKGPATVYKNIFS